MKTRTKKSQVEGNKQTNIVYNFETKKTSTTIKTNLRTHTKCRGKSRDTTEPVGR